jgi:hypothetical protein
MLLGVTPGSISKICDLEEDDLAALSEEEAVNTGFFNNFKKVLADKTKAFGNSGAAAEKDGREQNNDV